MERDVVKGNARSRGEFFSYALVSIVGLKGIDKVAKVGKFNKLGKGGAKVDGNTSLSSAAKVHTSNSLVPIPFNVFQTAKLKELVKHNVVSTFSKGSQWTKDFFRNDLVQKALKQGVVAISNVKTLSKIRNVVNPTAFNSFFNKTFNDVIKGPLAKTKVAIDQQFRKVVEGIGKVEIPSNIWVENRNVSTGTLSIRVPVISGETTTMKDMVRRISPNKNNEIDNLLNDREITRKEVSQKEGFEDSYKINIKERAFFSKKALEHIFHGNINGRGVPSGYHHSNINSEATLTNISTPDKFGVYKVVIEIEGKKKFSTFFPENWDRVTVLDKIKEAKNGVYINGDGWYMGRTKEGILIKMWINKNGEIDTAFPIYTK